MVTKSHQLHTIFIVTVPVSFSNGLMCVHLCSSQVQARKAESSLNTIKGGNLIEGIGYTGDRRAEKPEGTVGQSDVRNCRNPSPTLGGRVRGRRWTARVQGEAVWWDLEPWRRISPCPGHLHWLNPAVSQEMWESGVHPTGARTAVQNRGWMWEAPEGKQSPKLRLSPRLSPM